MELHYHCCIVDDVFEPGDDGSIRFLPAVAPTPQEIDAIAEQVRHRVLRWFARSGLLDADDVRDMLGWEIGRVSLDASVRFGGTRPRLGVFLYPRQQLSTTKLLEWIAGIWARSRLVDLHVRYLESAHDRLPGLEGLELAGCCR